MTALEKVQLNQEARTSSPFDKKQNSTEVCALNDRTQKFKIPFHDGHLSNSTRSPNETLSTV